MKALVHNRKRERESSNDVSAKITYYFDPKPYLKTFTHVLETDVPSHIYKLRSDVGCC